MPYVTAPARLPAGKIAVGPDHYGCTNTGMAPALMHSKFLRANPILGRGYRFVIGPEVFLQQAVRALVLGKVPLGRAYVEFNNGRDRVTFAKTYATAKTRFAFLTAEIIAANEAVRAKHTALRARANQGDMEAAVALMDF